ncbi:MAG TPA: ABC transporter permease [archaeon]|nr:ABC transporter permease [archaeon]
MLKLALSNLFRHKLRTLLSVAGIIIGVASLIALVSVVDGIKAEIQDALSQAQGARVVPLNATDPIFTNLDEGWGEKLDKIKGVKIALPNIIQLAKSIEGKPVGIEGTRVVGLDVVKLSSASGSGFSGELLEGRDFRPSDSGNYVAMVGEKIKDDYGKFVGSKINVNGTQLRITGIYTTGSDLLDNSILMPIDAARDVTGFPQGKVSFINVQLEDPSMDQEVVDRINLLYGNEVKATSLSDFSGQFGVIFDSITLLVVVIASIASIVAAVGIINTMLMSVLERFKEIGALKAVGWTNDNIMRMILYESFFVGVIGGVLGAATGIAASHAIKSFGLNSVVTPELFIGTILGSIIVGVLAGIYPAFIASRMNPVEALRYE